jgi:hypothetical protein
MLENASHQHAVVVGPAAHHANRASHQAGDVCVSAVGAGDNEHVPLLDDDDGTRLNRRGVIAAHESQLHLASIQRFGGADRIRPRDNLQAERLARLDHGAGERAHEYHLLRTIRPNGDFQRAWLIGHEPYQQPYSRHSKDSGDPSKDKLLPQPRPPHVMALICAS